MKFTKTQGYDPRASYARVIGCSPHHGKFGRIAGIESLKPHITYRIETGDGEIFMIGKPSVELYVKSMSKWEWIQRARMEFARRTNDFAFDWMEAASIMYDDWGASDFPDDPEGATSEEIYNWS